MHTITYRPRGVCSRNMEIDVEGDVIQSVRVEGGCSGNLQGICSLLKGMTVEEAVARRKTNIMPRPAGPGSQAGRIKKNRGPRHSLGPLFCCVSRAG